MIIVFGGEKGGTGKTTLATNFASMLAARGKEVILIDTNRQESSSSWCFVREEEKVMPRIPSLLKFGNNVKQELLELKKKYENIIVDCGGRDSIEFRASLLVADKGIIPLRAAQFDLWTISRFSSMLTEIYQVNESLEVHLVINAASTNPAVTEHEEAKTFMSEFENIKMLKSVIKERIAFHKAASEGKSVEELYPSDQKAINEMLAFYEEVMK